VGWQRLKNSTFTRVSSLRLRLRGKAALASNGNSWAAAMTMACQWGATVAGNPALRLKCVPGRGLIFFFYMLALGEWRVQCVAIYSYHWAELGRIFEQQAELHSRAAELEQDSDGVRRPT
jgi:hypothetical protein